MKQILITGANGLIGSHLIAAMKNDWKIYAAYRKIPDFIFPSVHPLLSDFSDRWDTEIFPDKINAVIHLAQSPDFRDFPDSAVNIFSVNLSSTMHLLDYARKAGAKTFILASSGGIYGHGDKIFSEENDAFLKNELGFYFGTKFCSEVLAENFSPFMNVIILRFFFVYGPGQKQQMLFPRILSSVINRKPVLLQGEHGISINPIYVDDAVEAIIKSTDLNNSHKINIGGEEILTLQQIGEIIGKTVGKIPIFECQTNTQSHNLVADIKKMLHFLGPPKVKFSDGIKLLYNSLL